MTLVPHELSLLRRDTQRVAPQRGQAGHAGHATHAAGTAETAEAVSGSAATSAGEIVDV